MKPVVSVWTYLCEGGVFEGPGEGGVPVPTCEGFVRDEGWG